MAAVFVWQVLQVIGFSGGPALAITAQGIDDFDEVAFLTDEKVTAFCKTVRKPGGAVVGQAINLTSESNLCLLCFYLWYLKRCSRSGIVGQMTLQAIRSLQSQRDQENDHKEPESPVIDSKDWARTMESIVEYCGSCLGVTNIPFAYVARKEMVPEQTPIGGWLSDEAEMIGCAPLVAKVAAVPMVLAEHYKTNNKTVWTKLAKMCCDHDSGRSYANINIKRLRMASWHFGRCTTTTLVLTMLILCVLMLKINLPQPSIMEKRIGLIGSAIRASTWSSMRYSKG
jgi:hypothetical protein